MIDPSSANLENCTQYYSIFHSYFTNLWLEHNSLRSLSTCFKLKLNIVKNHSHFDWAGYKWPCLVCRFHFSLLLSNRNLEDWYYPSGQFCWNINCRITQLRVRRTIEFSKILSVKLLKFCTWYGFFKQEKAWRQIERSVVLLGIFKK